MSAAAVPETVSGDSGQAPTGGATPPANGGFPPIVPPAPAAPASPVSPPAPSWTEGLSADDKAFLSAKGWDKEGKGVADIIKSYRNAERLRGVEVDKLARIPDWSKPEEVAEWRTRIGVPESPDKYENHEVETPTGILRAELLTPISHALGLRQEQHAEFLNATGKLIENLFQAQNEDVSRRNAAELADLKKEWGPKFDEHNQSVANAVAQLGLKEDFVEALKIAAGEAGTRRFLADLGTRLAEHKRPSEGNPAHVLMTPDVAKARMVQLRADRAWMDAHASGDAEKRREWSQLQTIAFGG